jgi:hypothetical protein
MDPAKLQPPRFSMTPPRYSPAICHAIKYKNREIMGVYKDIEVKHQKSY